LTVCRFVAAILPTLLLCACPGEPPAAPARGRVEVVPVDRGAAVDAFCEVRPAQQEAPFLSFPPLDLPAPALGAGWTWVSLWATWCGPCIEELPLLRAWQADLSNPVRSLDLLFLSVDADAAVLARARGANGALPAGPRVLDPAAVEPWLAAMGLDGGASIPIHLLVDPRGKVRCIRVGAVSAPDRTAVAALLAGG
jgi:thiol-disulfide isomerase/thioredoxin